MKRIICIILTVSVIICSFCFSASAAGLALTGANYPTSYTEGSYFTVYGTVKSDYTISSVTAGVYDGNGNVKFEHTAKPQQKSYNINNLDGYMTFSKLKAGTYKYVIKASDSQTSNKVLLNQSFTVKAEKIAEAGLTKVKWSVIDLSYWNEIYSWDDIGDSTKGVILRLGYRGTGNHVIYYDNMFATRYNYAKKQGLHVGCYFFSAALTTAEAEEEADYVIKTLKDNKCQMDMPIYFDMETDGQVSLSQANCTKVARAFCDKITKSGYYAGIYCNKYFARDELYADQLKDVTFWIAEYGSSCTYDGNYGMWQYTEYGTLPGISERVDKNYCYYDYPTYIKNNGLNGYPAKTVEPTYSVKAVNEVKVDTNSKIVSKVPANLTADQFRSTYTACSSDVTVVIDKTVSGNVATGTTVTFKKGSTVLAAYTVSVIGDVDGNSLVNSSDALSVLEHVVGLRSLSGVKYLSADCTNDGAVNSIDALEILTNAVRQ